MKELILDASFALRWCFEDEATAATEALLTALQNQETTARVPGIWPHEMLNGLGKGVTRGRMERQKALIFWREIRALPIHIVEVPMEDKLLELALQHNLSVYDASYLILAGALGLPLATADGKLKTAAERAGLEIIAP